MMKTEFKDKSFNGLIGGLVQLDTKAVSAEGEIEGYGAYYGNVDRGGDIVQAGAFDKSLSVTGAKAVKMLAHHDTWQPIGVWEEITSDSKGLLCKGRLILKSDGGRNMHELIKAGAIDGLSIGYRTKAEEVQREEGTRTITEAELWEVSCVTFPMNQQARILAAKAYEDKKSFAERFPTPRHLEEFVRDELGASNKEAKRLVAGGFKAAFDRDDHDADLAGFAKALAEMTAAMRA